MFLFEIWKTIVKNWNFMSDSFKLIPKLAT